MMALSKSLVLRMGGRRLIGIVSLQLDEREAG